MHPYLYLLATHAQRGGPVTALEGEALIVVAAVVFIAALIAAFVSSSGN
jgi:hypothetical protein